MTEQSDRPKRIFCRCGRMISFSYVNEPRFSGLCWLCFQENSTQWRGRAEVIYVDDGA